MSNDLITRIGLHSEVLSLSFGERARAILQAVVEQTGDKFLRSDRCPMCHPMTGFNTDDAVCAMHLAQQFVKETRIPKDEEMAARVIRVSGDAKCEICCEPYRQHPPFKGALYQGQPYLQMGCAGELLKL